MFRLMAVATVLCLIVMHEATTPAVKLGATILGFVLLPCLTLKGPGTRAERQWATATLFGAMLSYAVADFGGVPSARWGFVAFATAAVVPSLVKFMALAFPVIRNALRIRVLLRADGGDRKELIDELTRL